MPRSRSASVDSRSSRGSVMSVSDGDADRSRSPSVGSHDSIQQTLRLLPSTSSAPKPRLQSVVSRPVDTEPRTVSQASRILSIFAPSSLGERRPTANSPPPEEGDSRSPMPALQHEAGPLSAPLLPPAFSGQRSAYANVHLSDVAQALADKVLAGYAVPSAESKLFSRACPPPLHQLRRVPDLDKQLQILLASSHKSVNFKSDKLLTELHRRAMLIFTPLIHLYEHLQCGTDTKALSLVEHSGAYLGNLIQQLIALRRADVCRTLL